MGFMKKLVCFKKSEGGGSEECCILIFLLLLLKVPVIRISGFCSTKESKNSLLNSFDYDILNEASSNFVSKKIPT